MSHHLRKDARVVRKRKERGLNIDTKARADIPTKKSRAPDESNRLCVILPKMFGHFDLTIDFMPFYPSYTLE